jgi:hypothetical protein
MLLAHGVSWDDFWFGPVRAIWDYVDMVNYKIEEELNRDYRNAWTNGIYMLEAINSALSSKKSPHKYPKHPIKIQGEDDLEKEKERQKICDMIMFHNLKMKAIKAKYNE